MKCNNNPTFSTGFITFRQRLKWLEKDHSKTQHLFSFHFFLSADDNFGHSARTFAYVNLFQNKNFPGSIFFLRAFKIVVFICTTYLSEIILIRLPILHIFLLVWHFSVLLLGIQWNLNM